MSGQEREAGSAGRWRWDLLGGQGGIHPHGIGRTMDLKAKRQKGEDGPMDGAFNKWNY